MKVRTSLGAFVAILALSVSLAAFGGTPGAEANNGDAILAGQLNTATTGTLIQNTRTSVPDCIQFANVGLIGCGDIGLYGAGSGSGVGVHGSGGAGGVYGETSNSATSAVFGHNFGGGDGVRGTTAGAGASAVFGYNTGGGKGVFGSSTTGNGVEGTTAGADASAVYGHNTSGGGSVAKGVFGSATGGGTGVRGESANGDGVQGVSSGGTGVYAAGATALDVQGTSVFSRSGVVFIAYPNKAATVTVPGGLTSAALALATCQSNVGVYVKAAVPDTGTGTVRIILNKAPGSSSSPKTAKVAWFVLG